MFDSEKAALEAVEEMNGFEMYGKAMRVRRAMMHSDETVKRKAGDLFEEHKRKRLMLKGKYFSLSSSSSSSSPQTNLTHQPLDFKRAEEDAKALANPTAAAGVGAAAGSALDKQHGRAAKTGAAVVPDEYVRPNKTLFCQNIPRDVDEETLTNVFERFEGFKEVRLVSVRSVAFAEFENEQFAITAKEATANTPIGAEGKPMKVTYQRQQ